MLESRTEVDYGLASNLQVTGYLNASRVEAALSAPAAARIGAGSAAALDRTRVDGVTGEVIWRLASPYLQPVGFALLADVTAGRDPTDVGLKAIVQKNLRDDTVVLAANARLDVGQRETLPAQSGAPAFSRDVTRLETDVGVSWRFAPNWSAAMEVRARNRYAGGGLRDQAIYAGPTLHYGAARWFLTLSALSRVAGRHRAAAGDPTPGGLTYLAERTRWDGVRLRLGTTF